MSHKPTGVRVIFGTMVPRAQEVILTARQQAGARSPQALRDVVVFVTGSLFLIAEARDTIGVPA
jgi:hypothetical protein